MRRKMMYCKICKRETTHTRVDQSLPWSCTNKHFDDTRCQNCGVKLSKETLKIAKALGATVKFCKKCNGTKLTDEEALRIAEILGATTFTRKKRK